MPTLDFKGKPFVYSHHLGLPFKELRIEPDKSLAGVKGLVLDDNLIIKGDNLEALKALLPRYAGRVDIIYIDPPYNTGKDEWRYNDRVNSPLMQSWLGSVVNKEDMERHDKWLCMMWPRLQLLYELLAPHGVIYVSIDDNESSSLKEILSEIFGDDNWLGTVVWKNATDNNPTRIAIEHEYIHVFSKNKAETEKVWKAPHVELKETMLAKGAELLKTFKGETDLVAAYRAWYRKVKAQLGPLSGYELIDRKGIYAASRSVHNPGKQGYDWDLLNPKTQQNVPKPLMGYRFPEETRDELLADDRIIFSDDPEQLIRLKTYLEDYQEKMPSVIEIDGRRGANELRQLSSGGVKLAFKNPKTFTLLEMLLSYVAKPDALILDSFAGSGTTAHAVLALNKADGGDRRFILVEAEDYADTLTAERVRRVIKGVPDATSEPFQTGWPGSFTYCELGEEMNLERFFEADGKAPPWARLAEYVAYTATGETLTTNTEGPDGYAGVVGGVRLHLLYRPDQKWMRSNEAMFDMLTAERISKAGNGDPVLVFAAGKFMTQRTLTSLGITFCQLPYSIHRILGEGTEGVAGVDAA